MRMRATEAYFKAKEAEIMRMEDSIASSEVVSATAPIASVPPMPPMPISSIPASVPPATSATQNRTDCQKEVSIGTEDGILLKCIERYIENNRFCRDKLENLKDILAIWCGYNGIISDPVRENIEHYQERIMDIQMKDADSKRSMTLNNYKECYLNNAQKIIKR